MLVFFPASFAGTEAGDVRCFPVDFTDVPMDTLENHGVLNSIHWSICASTNTLPVGAFPHITGPFPDNFIPQFELVIPNNPFILQFRTEEARSLFVACMRGTISIRYGAQAAAGFTYFRYSMDVLPLVEPLR